VWAKYAESYNALMMFTEGQSKQGKYRPFDHWLGDKAICN